MEKFRLPCPCCGEEEAPISLSFADANFTCHECDSEFELEFINGLLSKWKLLLVWLETMPDMAGGAS